MFENLDINYGNADTIQHIALRLVGEQLQMLSSVNRPKERTILIVGSRAVGKSSVINKFFDRDENSRPTLALDYSYGRRSGPIPHLQKQVVNIWELGSLENTDQLIEVPMWSHGVAHFSALIMVDISQPQRVWTDLQLAHSGLKKAFQKVSNDSKEQQITNEEVTQSMKKEHIDLPTLDMMPFPVVIIGGKYDLFMDFDPELKKHVCRCLRSMAHLIGASLLFYSSKVPKLAKTLRDTISHLAFGSPSNPFRVHVTDYNDALSVWFGRDSWENISPFGALSLERIGSTFSVEVPQLQTPKPKQNTDTQHSTADPSTDPGFRESIIDEMRAQKDEELYVILKHSQLRAQFESVSN